MKKHTVLVGLVLAFTVLACNIPGSEQIEELDPQAAGSDKEDVQQAEDDTGGEDELAAYKGRLEDAITQEPPDYAYISGELGGEFEIRWYNAQPQVLTADQAMVQIESEFLPDVEGVTPQIAPIPPTSALDVFGGWSLDADVVDVVFVTGAGYPGDGSEAIFAIAEREDGSFWVPGVIYSLEGFGFGVGGGQVDEPAANPDVDAFRANLTNSVQAKDFDMLAQLMGDRFGIGLWRSQGISMAPQNAVAELEQNYLTPASAPVFPLELPSNLPPDLDPLGIWGPDVNVVEALYSTGWGSDGLGEAFLIIALNDNGSPYWHAMLWAPMGFAEPGAGSGDLGNFRLNLTTALLPPRSTQTVTSLMDDTFIVGYWRSEGVEYSPAEAFDAIQQIFLPNDAVPEFPDQPAYTLPADLNVLGIWNPSVNVVDAVYSTGWGEGGAGEAFLIIAQRPDGTYFWYSVLYSFDQFQ